MNPMHQAGVRAAFDTARKELAASWQAHTGSYGNASILRMRHRIIEMLEKASRTGDRRVELSDALSDLAYVESTEERATERKNLNWATRAVLPLIRALVDVGFVVIGQECYPDIHVAIREVLATHGARMSFKTVEEVMDKIDLYRVDDVTGSVLIHKDERHGVAVAEIERQLVERGLLSKGPQGLAGTLVLDGTDEYGNYAGDENRPPFAVFDVTLQRNVAGPFPTMAEAHGALAVHAASKALEAHQNALGIEGDPSIQVWQLLLSLQEYCAVHGVGLDEQLADVRRQAESGEVASPLWRASQRKPQGTLGLSH